MAYLIIDYIGPISRIKGTSRLENPSAVVIIIEKNVHRLVYLYMPMELINYLLIIKLVNHFKNVIQDYTKGTYNYELTKILDNSINTDDYTLNDKLIDYKIKNEK